MYKYNPTVLEKIYPSRVFKSILQCDVHLLFVCPAFGPSSSYKLLVAGGSPYANSVEVVDLSNSSSRCANLADLPVGVLWPGGFLFGGSRPIIAGGSEFRNSMPSCLSHELLLNKSWVRIEGELYINIIQKIQDQLLT